VAGLLLAAATLFAVLLLTAPGPLDDARAWYGRIQVGMTLEEVETILSGWEQHHWTIAGGSVALTKYDPQTGATIEVDFASEAEGSEVKVAGKHFRGGDQSFRSRVERLMDRLADRLHHGP
jgi:hypothetical protein